MIIYMFYPQQENLRSVEKISPAQKSSTHVSLEEVAREEGLAARENKEAERVLKKLGVELAESSGIRRIFPEIQLLAGTRPGSEITEVCSLSAYCLLQANTRSYQSYKRSF